jgi:hypothetical protein
MRTTNERFLSAGVTFEVGLASECRCMQLVLVLTVHWWPTPVNVGGLLDAQGLYIGQIDDRPL